LLACGGTIIKKRAGRKKKNKKRLKPIDRVADACYNDGQSEVREMCDNRYKTIPQLAKLLNCSPQTVWRYIQDGEIEYFRVPGGTYRISDEAAQDFIERYTIKAKINGERCD